MSRVHLTAAVLFLLVTLAAAARAQDGLRVTDSIEPAFPVADHVTGDVDGDGRDDLVVVGTAGEVRAWRRNDAGDVVGPAGTLDLPDPARTLLALAKLRPEDAGRSLLALGPQGLVAYPPATGGAPAPRAVPHRTSRTAPR